MIEDQFVVFHLGEEEYAVQISQVKEIINYTMPTRIPSSMVDMLGVINLRNKLLPIVDLGQKIGIESEKKINEKKIIIIDSGKETFGVIVDEVAEVLKIQQENIEGVGTDISQGNKYILGIAKENKRLLLLVDLKTLIGGDF
jgi:purine-binding chemotaxis protein CheW